MAAMIILHPALLHEAKHDPVLKYMLEHNIPVTRETWMSMNYLGHPPDPWTDEDEAEVPAPFQRNSDD